MKDKGVLNKTKSRLAWFIAIVFAIIWAVISVFPLIYMVINSFKGRFEIMTSSLFALPESWYPATYIEIVTGNFWRYFLNSVLVLVVSLLLLLCFAAAAAYPLSRFRFKAAGTILAMIVACMSIPIHVTLIPIFRMSTRVGVYDSIWALTGPYIAFGLPISIFILSGFMSEIPREIEEAAMIDGCGKIRMFSKIILPMSRPGLATLAIYNGVNMWNEFSFAYTLTQSASNRTLPLSIWEYKGQYTMNTPMILSVLTLTILPMLIMFIIFGDKLIEGMSAGAVKG